MIEINLIPIKKRRRLKKGGIFPAGFVLPREVIIGLVGGFLVLLAIWHILLQFIIGVEYVQLKAQQSKWQKILPEKEKVDVVIQELRSRQLKIKTINELRDGHNILWSAKLNGLSDALPGGVWFRGIVFEDGDIMINGSSVSKHKLEKINIYNFVKRIKQNPLLMGGVSSVDVESIKSHQVGEVSVADFLVHFTLVNKEEPETKTKAKAKVKAKTK